MRFLKRSISYFLIIVSIQSIFGFDIGDIPVQDEGRIKPLDTYARNHLLAFYGKRSIKELDLTATDWLMNLVLDPHSGRQQRIFNIRNPDVTASLSLEWSSEHKYSFNEIAPALNEQSAILVSIDEKPNEERTVFEKQLLELSRNAMRFEEISYLKALKLIPPGQQNDNDEWVSPVSYTHLTLPTILRV